KTVVTCYTAARCWLRCAEYKELHEFGFVNFQHFLTQPASVPHYQRPVVRPVALLSLRWEQSISPAERRQSRPPIDLVVHSSLTGAPPVAHQSPLRRCGK